MSRSSGENESFSLPHSSLLGRRVRTQLLRIPQKKKMRLLWVCLVFVGVVGGVAKDAVQTFSERWEACQLEIDKEFCLYGFLFTATALNEVGKDGEVEVVLSLEKSLHPHVTFDLSLRTAGKKKEVDWKEKILANGSVTMEVNELRRVVLRVSDLEWTTAELLVTAYATGHPQIRNELSRDVEIRRVTSEVEVFVQTDKEEYAPGESVDFRVVVVDGSVDKSTKFAQIIVGTPSGKEQTRLPWVDVAQSGILRGNFPIDGHTEIGASATSDVTSSVSTATARPLRIRENRFPYEIPLTWVWFEGLSDVYFSQPRLTGRVMLTSFEGLPLEGNCNVTIRPDPSIYRPKTTFSKDLAERNVTLGVAGGEFEFDVVGELGAVRAGAEELEWLFVKATCTHVPSGSVAETTDTVLFYRSLFIVDLMSVGGSPLPIGGNSSHPQTTVVLQFLVQRRDGRSVEDSSKGLRVELLLSEENLKRLRPSATQFSLPIPADGRVRLEFQVDGTPPSPWDDAVRMEVGDVEEQASLAKGAYLIPLIHVTPVDPARLIRRGDVVRFRVRSCFPYGSVNALMSSSRKIFAAQRFSLSRLGEELDGVIELQIPQSVTEGSLNLIVYGLSTTPQAPMTRGDSASIQVNLVPSSGPQFIKIVDKVDVEMSTTVTFRLEGTLVDSVVTLQAAKLESLEGYAEGREQKERPFCQQWGHQNYQRNRDDSPGAVDPRVAGVSANFDLDMTSFSVRHPSLVFLDVDWTTSAKDNGTLTVTKTFDRLTQFGTYVVSGATFNSKSGRTVFSNSPVLRILPPPVTLGVFVPPSVVLGETVEVLGYVKNNQATRFKGHVTLQISEGGSTEVREELVEINPNSYNILRMQATPGKLGELVVSLRSNISSRLTATKNVKVIPSKLNF